MKDILIETLGIIGVIILIILAISILAGAIFCCVQLVTAKETIEVLRYGFLLLILFPSPLLWSKK